MRILFVVAEMQEAQRLIEYYKLEKSPLPNVNFWVGEGIFQLVLTGPGINNIINSLSRLIYVGALNYATHIINVGYAGAKNLDIGRVVTVSKCHCLEFPTKANTAVENCINLSNKGFDCYTSFDFVEKAETVKEEKALFDMELAYIARFLYKSLHSIKIVSDKLDYDTFKEFSGNINELDEKAWKAVLREIQRITCEIKRGR